MSRPLRIEFPHALYHVISRGNNRGDIVWDDADRQKRLEWLGRAVEQYGWKLHAFCLMTNHEHLFVQTPEPNLSAGMKLLNGAYTQYFNVRHNCCGPLFQGRFKSFLVEGEGYHLTLSAYIHLNPVRAKMVADPADYRWSSFAGYEKPLRHFKFVTEDRILRLYDGLSREAQRSRYAAYVRRGIEEPPECPWTKAWQGFVLGGAKFIKKVKAEVGLETPLDEVPLSRHVMLRPSLEEIRDAAARAFGEDAAAWVPGSRSNLPGRAVAAWLAFRRFGYGLREAGDVLGYRRHSGTSSAAERVADDKALLAKAEELSETLLKN